MEKLLARVLPFIIAGVMAVILFFGIILLSYVLIWGFFIGLFFYLAHAVYRLFVKPKQPLQQTTVSREQKQGRIIDHDEHD